MVTYCAKYVCMCTSILEVIFCVASTDCCSDPLQVWSQNPDGMAVYLEVSVAYVQPGIPAIDVCL